MSTIATMPASGTNSTTRATRRARSLAVAGATAAALVAWAIAQAVAELTVRYGSGSGSGVHHVGVASVAAVSTLVGLAAWGSLFLLERSAANARRAWTAIAVAVLAVSSAGPLGAGVGGSTKAALLCIHLTVAGVLIPCLARTA